MNLNIILIKHTAIYCHSIQRDASTRHKKGLANKSLAIISICSFKKIMGNNILDRFHYNVLLCNQLGY